MIITLLCDNPKSWIVPYVKKLEKKLIELGHKVYLVDKYTKIPKGDLAFLLGCEKVVPIDYLKLNKHNLVVHESNLPKGKGWSPLTWQILEGKNSIPITLFEAKEEVDSGDIYLKDYIQLDGTELFSEIKQKQGISTIDLVLEFVRRYPNIKGYQQQGEESFYDRRTPQNSEIDIDKTIREQFNLLRVVDNERYPAFFYINGQKYIIKVYRG